MIKKSTISLEVRPVVAHFNNVFFVRSETFIYQYVTHLKEFEPILVSWKEENGENFPFPGENRYLLQLSRYSPKWFYYGLKKSIFNRNFYFERIMKERNVCLLHAHFGHNGVQALRLKGKMDSSLPLITTFYGADLSIRKTVEMLKDDYLELFEKGDMFLVEGEHMRHVLYGLGCPWEKIRIQRIAIPVHSVTYRERKPKEDGKTVQLIFCGRFTEKKGLIYALEAVKNVWEDGGERNFRFCVIGDGEMRGEIDEFIARNRMESYVDMKGFLNYREYMECLESSDIFVHPSVTASDGDSEGGAPTTILEAQAMGLPVISTVHADIPNIVIPDKSALLSPERDTEHLARNIRHLLKNQDLWSKMGEVGRKFVEEHHDIEKEVLKLEEKYRSLINK